MNSLTKWVVAVSITGTLTGSCLSMDVPKEVPFELHNGHLILVKGSIGEWQDLNFLIDTGASTTLVNSPLAKKMKLDGKKKVLFAYGKQIKARSTILHNVLVGTRRFTPVSASIADLSVLPGVGRKIDVIIGTNALVRANFTIDYQSKQLTFNPDEPLKTRTEFDATDLKLVVKLQVQDQTVRLLIDSGAGDLILFRERLDGLPLRRVPQGKKANYHLGSAEELNMVQLSRVQLGPEELGTVRAYLQNGRIDGYNTIQGTLGILALGFNRVQFDFDNQLFSWE